MSTILDALRKVEREREPTAEPSLAGPTVSSTVRRRRSFPIAAIALCAVVGFGGGALLSWWWPSEAPVELAALPAPPPPPDIAVPRPPLRAQPKAPAAPREQQPATAVQAEAPPGAPPAVAPQARPTEVEPKGALAAKPSGLAAAEGPRPVAEEPATPERLAALDKQGSALEPSPFTAPREAAREGGPPSAAPKAAPAVVPPATVPVPSEQIAQDLAALAPNAPAAPPPVEAAPAESEADPAAPAETLFDTGRSPPGAPKVALSFLQWSPEPARRFAFISIDGAPTQRIHEGEVAAGLTVAAITPTGVQFKREGTTFVIRPRH